MQFEQPQALYKNLGGIKLRDVTVAAGVNCGNRICRGAVFADINGDGWLDLLVSTVGSGVLCFTNKGDGTFAECSQYAGTLSPYGATTMTLADIDGNGPLDLYVADNRNHDHRDLAEFSHLTFSGSSQMVVSPALQDRFIYTNGYVEEYRRTGFPLSQRRSWPFSRRCHGPTGPFSTNPGAHSRRAKQWAEATLHELDGGRGLHILYIRQTMEARL